MQTDDGEWTDVNDRLPMHGTSVLVKIRSGHVLQGKYVEAREDPKQGFIVPASLAYDDITHWRYEFLTS